MTPIKVLRPRTLHDMVVTLPFRTVLPADHGPPTVPLATVHPSLEVTWTQKSLRHWTLDTGHSSHSVTVTDTAVTQSPVTCTEHARCELVRPIDMALHALLSLEDGHHGSLQPPAVATGALVDGAPARDGALHASPGDGVCGVGWTNTIEN